MTPIISWILFLASYFSIHEWGIPPASPTGPPLHVARGGRGFTAVQVVCIIWKISTSHMSHTFLQKRIQSPELTKINQIGGFEPWDLSHEKERAKICRKLKSRASGNVWASSYGQITVMKPRIWIFAGGVPSPPLSASRSSMPGTCRTIDWNSRPYVAHIFAKPHPVARIHKQSN